MSRRSAKRQAFYARQKRMRQAGPRMVVISLGADFTGFARACQKASEAIGWFGVVAHRSLSAREVVDFSTFYDQVHRTVER